MNTSFYGAHRKAGPSHTLQIPQITYSYKQHTTYTLLTSATLHHVRRRVILLSTWEHAASSCVLQHYVVLTITSARQEIIIWNIFYYLVANKSNKTPIWNLVNQWLWVLHSKYTHTSEGCINQADHLVSSDDIHFLPKLHQSLDRVNLSSHVASIIYCPHKS